MKPFYKVKDAAEFYGVGRNRLYIAIKNKRLRAYKPNGKTLLLKASDVEEWIEKFPV